MMDLNYFVIIVSTVASFILGMTWYSGKAFGKIWMKHSSFTEADIEKAKKEGMGKSMLLGFLTQLFMAGAFNYALILSNVNPFCIAALFAIGIILPIMADMSIWEKTSWVKFYIGYGYRVSSLLLTALIFWL